MFLALLRSRARALAAEVDRTGWTVEAVRDAEAMAWGMIVVFGTGGYLIHEREWWMRPWLRTYGR